MIVITVSLPGPRTQGPSTHHGVVFTTSPIPQHMFLEALGTFRMLTEDRLFDVTVTENGVDKTAEFVQLVRGAQEMFAPAESMQEWR